MEMAAQQALVVLEPQVVPVVPPLLMGDHSDTWCSMFKTSRQGGRIVRAAAPAPRAREYKASRVAAASGGAAAAAVDRDGADGGESNRQASTEATTAEAS